MKAMAASGLATEKGKRIGEVGDYKRGSVEIKA